VRRACGLSFRPGETRRAGRRRLPQNVGGGRSGVAVMWDKGEHPHQPSDDRAGLCPLLDDGLSLAAPRPTRASPMIATYTTSEAMIVALISAVARPWAKVLIVEPSAAP
jgi:hypothetical protein